MVTIYFLIIPAFVLYAVAMAVALMLSTGSRDPHSIRPYLASVLIWSTIGFLVANALLIGSWFLPQVLSDTDYSEDSRLIALLIVGPLFASAVGLIGGAVFAIRRVGRKSRPG
jgi:hypothetical protein